MGDWSNNLEYEHREYYGHFYDTDEDVHEEETDMSDLISRQAVLDELEKWDWQDLYLPIHFKQILDDVPSVENKGEWLDDGFYAEGHSEHAYRCSECGEHYIGYVGEFKFCPNCGADMRGGE